MGSPSVIATANATAGSYTVTASVNGIAGSLDFDLTNNLIPPSFSGVTDQSITYGTPRVTITGTLADGLLVPRGETVAVTLNGHQQSATINSNGSFSTIFNTSALPVAGSPYSVSCAYTSDGNFTAANAMPTRTVTQATPTITWNEPDPLVHGTALGATQLDATASVPGTFTYTPSAGTVLTAGSGQTLSVSFTPTDNTDYTTATATATLNVGKATPSITWANLASITYGAALTSAQLDATASVPGTFTYTPAAGTVLHAGNGQTLSASFAPTDTTDFNTASATATLNVDKATPSITWANLADMTYGRALSSAQLDATASMPGTPHLYPLPGDGASCGNRRDDLGQLHARRHHRLQRNIRHGDDQRRESNARHHLGQSRRHYLRHGANIRAARCDCRRTRHVHLYPGRRDGARSWKRPDALGGLHAPRFVRLLPGRRSHHDHGRTGHAHFETQRFRRRL